MNPQIEETASKLARLPPNPSPPVGPDLSLRQLLVTLRMDQEACWQQGQRISAEEYLQAHPTLQTDRELAVELIYAEFLLREQRGESPDIEEYRRRFPQYAERLQLQIELHRAIQAQTATRGEDGSLGFLPFSPSPPPGYEIVEELGRGAMGLVYRAYQVRLKRWVALKVLRADGQEDAGQLARFRTEAEAAAQLRHPHIVQIHEIGDHDGRPYLAMEYVEGGNLARFLNGAPQPARFCAALLEKLARALQVAHDHGIIHRDLKPGNVLLQESETRNPKSEEESQMRDPKSEKDQTTPRSDFGFRIPDFEPKIADFGLAKFADASSTWAGGGATQTGMIMGTPSYMAPEQASGTNRQIGAGTDVYALGAVLYEMLTGRPPFRGESMWDTLQQVQFQEPVSPSRLQPKVPRDLETICLKCLQKKPFNRYGSALALAEDLARFLHDRPILARRSSASERAWRWCRRNPVVASLTGSVLLLLVILLGMSLVDNARLGEQLGKVERAEKEKTDKLWDSYFASARASRWSGRPGRRFDGLEAIRQAAAIRTNLRLRNEGIALLTLSDVRIAGELPNGFPPGTAAVTLDPDFVHYARSDSKGNISVRTVAEDREVGLLSGFGTHAWLMGFSPNGRFLSALYHDPGRERIWDWRRSRVVLEGDITGGIDFRPNSAQASVGQKDGHIAIWDLDSEKIVQRLQVGAPKDGGSSGYFDPSGNLLAVCEDRPEVKIFELATGKLIRQLNVAEIGAIAWEPSGTQLAHISPTRITVWNARTWTQQTVLNTPDSHTTHAAFGAGGRVLASAGWDGILRLWDPAAGRELLALHGALVPRFSRDGARLGPTLEGTAIHTWEVTTSGQYRVLHPPLGPSHPTLGAEFSPDGTLLAQFDDSGTSLWQVANRRNIATLPTGMCSGAVFTEDGSALFLRSAVGLERWPIANNTATIRIGPPQLVAGLPWDMHFGRLVAFPSGKLLANLRNEGVISFFDPRDPTSQVKLTGHTGSGHWLAASPDGHWVANTSYWDFPDKLRVSDVHTGNVVWSYPFNTPGSFSPDSRWLATGGDACRIWETGTWRQERIIPSPPGLGAVIHAVFAPDGSTLAIAHEGQVVRLVNARSGEELAALPTPDLPHADRLTFSSDGAFLAFPVEKVGVQLWDLRTLRAQLAELGLDWDSPPLPPAPEKNGAVMQAVVDDGNTTPPPESLALDEKGAIAHQQTWAERLGVPVQITNSIGMNLRLVPRRSDSFYCGTTKVTVGQYRLFTKETAYKTTGESSKAGGVKIYGDDAGQKQVRNSEYSWSHPDIALGEDHPVSMVTWQDAMAFCDWLSKREGCTYRLPTVEEWQWAARAGTTTRYYFGDDSTDFDEHVWHSTNSDWHTHPVGQKKPNPWGLYDIHGNVWDTCYTWRRSGRTFGLDQLRQGPGPTDQTVLLGGSYGDGVGPISFTGFNNSNIPHSHFGFRLILVGDLQSASKGFKPSKSE